MKEIQLTQGYVALVDDEDYDMVNYFSWHVMKRKNTNYASTQACVIDKNNIMITMHWLVLNKVSKGYEIDHIDGDGLNNQKSNLRIVTHIQNMQNKRHIENKTSKYKGVFIAKGEKKYRCAIKVNNKILYLGKFIDEKEAAIAYNNMAKKHFGEYALLNIIE